MSIRMFKQKDRGNLIQVFGFALLLLVLILQWGQVLHAGTSSKEGRSKVIDFDGDLVEGMNKRPFDSLSQLSEAQKKRKASHLYRKRKGFRTEIKESVKSMRYSQ